MNDQVLYNAKGVLVTTSRVVAGRLTHTLADVTSACWCVDEGQRLITLAAAFSVWGSAMLIAIVQAGPGVITVSASCVALAAVALPPLFVRRYSIILVTSGGQRRAASNLKQTIAQHLTRIINQAVIARQRCTAPLQDSCNSPEDSSRER